MPHADPQKRREYEAAYMRGWRARNSAKVAQYGKDYRKRVRSQIIEMYGGKCACCGKTEPLFLTIDHINGGGKVHRQQFRGIQSFYFSLKREGFSNDYRLLCWNCNSGRYFNGGSCPHQDKGGSGL